MADLDYFDPRIVTGVINKRPRKHVLFTDMFHRQQPSAAEVFELHIVSKGISMLPAITNHSAGTMRQGKNSGWYSGQDTRAGKYNHNSF